MAIELSKQALDLGIVTADCQKMRSFYEQVLGFKALDPITFPGVATIHRLVVGDSVLRLVDADKAPAPHANGELFASAGLRYMTLTANNLEEVVEACREFGVNVPRPPTEIRPGVLAVRIQDPDGNWIELQSR